MSSQQLRSRSILSTGLLLFFFFLFVTSKPVASSPLPVSRGCGFVRRMWLQHQRGAAEALRSLRGFTLTGELQARRRRGDAFALLCRFETIGFGEWGVYGRGRGEAGASSAARHANTVGGSEVEESRLLLPTLYATPTRGRCSKKRG